MAKEDKRSWSIFAIAGFVLSFLIFYKIFIIFFSIICSIIGIIQTYNGDKKGKGFAIAGLIMGVLVILFLGITLIRTMLH